MSPVPRGKLKILVLCLEGAGFRLFGEYLVPLLEKRGLSGGLHPLKLVSPLDQAAPAAWTACLTGAGPETSGSFPGPGRAAVTPVSPFPPIWEALGRSGIPAGALHPPGSWALRPFHGAVVLPPLEGGGPGHRAHPSFLARDMADLPALSRPEESLDVPADRDVYYAAASALDRMRVEHARRLAGEGRLKALLVGLCLPEAACRLFRRRPSWIESALNQAARHLDFLLETLEPRALALLGLPGHGLPAVRAVHPVGLLERWGWLKYSPGGLPLARPRPDHLASPALAGPAGIYLQTPDRARRADMLARLEEALSRASGPLGEPALEALWRREELWQGPRGGCLPDLLWRPAPGFRISLRRGRTLCDPAVPSPPADGEPTPGSTGAAWLWGGAATPPAGEALDHTGLFRALMALSGADSREEAGR